MAKKKVLIMGALVMPLLLNLCACGEVTTSDETTSDTTLVNPYLDKLSLTDETDPYVLDESITNKNGSLCYELFVRSFYDSNGDGVGDLNGVIAKIPYLKSLGIKSIWMMPIEKSPSYHGYDISNYYQISPEYGTIEDLKNLVKELAKENIDLYMDMVFNHSSKINQYFLDSIEAEKNEETDEDSKRFWYNWSSNSKTGYNHCSANGKYYESRFDSGMPDFNLDNPYVRDEIKNIMKYYLDLGIKGFRLDAVLYYYYGNNSKNIEFLNFLKQSAIDLGYPQTYFVGEAWDKSFNNYTSFYTSKCDSFFAFLTSLDSFGDGTILDATKSGNANTFTKNIEKIEAKIKLNNPEGLSSYFLSNHDMDRSAKNFVYYDSTGKIVSDDSNAKLAANITYLLPGTPYIYYGEEIALKGIRGSSDNTDALRRLPFIWSSSNKKGETSYPEKNNVLSYVQKTSGAEDDALYTTSLLNHYKKVGNVRNKYQVLKSGSFKSLSSKLTSYADKVLAYKVYDDNETIYVLTNASSSDTVIKLSDVTTDIVNIDSSIDNTKKIPSLIDGYLSIGAKSTVILK